MSCITVVLHGHVQGAPHQVFCYEDVVHRYNQQGNHVENEKGGHGVDFGMQLPSMRVGGAGDKAFISGANVESVEI